MSYAGFDPEVVRLVLAGALGLFLGLEREWSEKDAGVRTLSLVALLGAAFEIVGRPGLLVVGGVLTVVMGTILSVEGLRTPERGLSLTTAVTLLVAYAVGVLVGAGFLLEGVTVAVGTALVLVLKRELHGLAESLTREEVRAASEFAVLAFVGYPLLPPGERTLQLAGATVAVEPRTVWTIVVFVAGIGIVNYAVVQTYGSRGVVITGFFGGLASSTAVVGSMLEHVRRRSTAADYAVAAVLLANAAMALRNLVIVLAFTVAAGPLLGVVPPLAVVVLGSVAVAALVADRSESVELELDSPFTLRYALAFGGLFFLVVIAGGLAQATLGSAGFLATAFLAGLVSSAGATTSAVLLYRAGTVDPGTAVLAVLLATAASIAVKVGLTLLTPERSFGLRVAGWSAALLVVGGAVALSEALFV